MELACGSSYARAQQSHRTCSPALGETFTLWLRQDSAGGLTPALHHSQRIRVRVSDYSASDHAYLGACDANGSASNAACGGGVLGWGAVELPASARDTQHEVEVPLYVTEPGQSASAAATQGRVWLRIHSDTLTDDSAGAAAYLFFESVKRLSGVRAMHLDTSFASRVCTVFTGRDDACACECSQFQCCRKCCR